MSNAAVINATATLGRVVGSPITIITDGTVTPKAYGKGSGAWSATLAFAPVVNGVTGSPVTLTISNNQPANVSQSILTDATSWVGWVVSSAGEFEATGIVEGVTGSDSLSGFLGIYSDYASVPKYAIETGSTAMVAGAQMQWDGTGWAAVGGGALGLLDADALLIVGDSISGGAVETINVSGARWRLAYIGTSIPAWMQALLCSRRFRNIHVRGRSGIRASEIASGSRANWTLKKLSSSSNAGNVFIHLGTNDIDADCNITINSIKSIANYFTSEGRHVSIASIIPRRIGENLWTLANQKNQSTVNSGIKKLCTIYGYGYVPIAESFTNYSVTDNYAPLDGDYRVNYDGIHPNLFGGFLAGKVLASHYSNRNSKYESQSSSLWDTVLSNNNNINLLPNPMLNGVAEYTIPTTLAGGTLSRSVVAAPDGIGNALQIDFSGATSAASGNFILCDLAESVPMVSGDTVESSCYIKVDGFGGSGSPVGLFAVQIRSQFDGTNTFTQGFGKSYGIDVANQEAYMARIFTPPMVASSSDSIKSKAFMIIPDFAAGASFRLTIWGMRTEKNLGAYSNKFPWCVSNSDNPVGPQNIPLA